MMKSKIVVLMLVTLSGLSACGGSSSSATATPATPSLVGTWGNAVAGGLAETDTFNSNNTFALSQGGCTYTGGTYSIAGNKFSVVTLPTTAVASGTCAPAACSTATVSTALTGYSFTYSISGNTLTYVDAAGTTAIHQLAGKWSNTGTLGTEEYTFNTDGTYAYSATPNVAGATLCSYSGGSYSANGETLTYVTAPAAALTNNPLTCAPVQSLVNALASLVSTISITSATSFTATTAGVATVYTRI